MTLQIGRLGLTTSLRAPSEVSFDGNRCRLAGFMAGASVDDVEALVQQALGYPNPAEPYQPVIYTENPRVDGLHMIDGPPQVDAILGASPPNGNWYEVAVDTIRHPSGAQSARPQSRLWGGLRTNGHSIAAGSTTPWHAVPSTRTAYGPIGVTSVAANTRSGDGVALSFYDPASQVFYDARVGWRLPLADWYAGSPTLRVGGYPVVGRQIVNDPTDWTFGNGLIEFSPGSGCVLQTRMHNGTAWGSNAGIEVGVWNNGSPFGSGSWVQAATAPISVEHLPGAHPGWAAIKLDIPATVGGLTEIMELEISLRRGARMAECVLRTSRNGGRLLGVRPDSTGTATDITGLAYLDTAVSTHRLCFASASTYSVDTASTGTFVLSSVGRLMDLGIGWENAGSSSSNPDRAADLKAQYFGPVTETIEVG